MTQIECTPNERDPKPYESNAGMMITTAVPIAQLGYLVPNVIGATIVVSLALGLWRWGSFVISNKDSSLDRQIYSIQHLVAVVVALVLMASPKDRLETLTVASWIVAGINVLYGVIMTLRRRQELRLSQCLWSFAPLGMISWFR
ncbi:MAG: hypothetical protein D8M22_08730 [Armatimonadetes bacterium]|nr:hypothetical protein [Armatimonadota bacterium]